MMEFDNKKEKLDYEHFQNELEIAHYKREEILNLFGKNFLEIYDSLDAEELREFEENQEIETDLLVSAICKYDPFHIFYLMDEPEKSTIIDKVSNVNYIDMLKNKKISIEKRKEIFAWRQKFSLFYTIWKRKKGKIKQFSSSKQQIYILQLLSDPDIGVINLDGISKNQKQRSKVLSLLLNRAEETLRTEPYASSHLKSKLSLEELIEILCVFQELGNEKILEKINTAISLKKKSK